MSGTLAIPASAIVGVTPSVLGAGGNALDLNGLVLTASNRIPIGTVQSFSSTADVSALFGPTSQEFTIAGNYFLGFDNSNQKPGQLLMAQYNQAAVPAYVRGGSMASVSLAALQAFSGTLTFTIDGVPHTSGAINLSSATSFSNAAELMTIGLGLVGQTTAQFTGSISGTLLTVSALSSGSIAVGQEVRGASITAGTVVSSFGTGTGGTGTYNLTNSQTVSSESMTCDIPTITYDPITSAFVVASPTTGASSSVSFATGTLADNVNLRQSDGAVASPGAVAATPAAFMANVVIQTQNWASFMTLFDPDGGAGNTQKQAFAAWVNSVVDRYHYVAWDTDVTPTLSNSAPASLGGILKASQSDGTTVIYSPLNGPALSAFLMGAVASIDFTETNGRATLAFRQQSGILPDITNQTVAANLIANGYNFYGVYATSNERFNFLYPGQVSGKFLWIDSYINQIWLNNQFQLAMIVLLQNTKSIPYNQAGYGQVRASLMDPINQAVNFGAIRAGVTLSQAQISEINTAAGAKIDTTLTNQGWYLQIKDALPQVRVARGSPPITFWYMDGQSIQKLAMASVEVQ